MPCMITTARAAMPKLRIQRRSSVRQVQSARMIVRRPTNSASMRWPCSNRTPPTIGGILQIDPKLVGQSGTESPASLLVTKAPARIKVKIAPAMKTAKIWRARS